jgi:Fe-coproporphyrin III synthase
MGLINRIRTLVTHKIYELPIIVMMPHSSCNCRCVMCDIWKSNHLKRELTLEELEKHVSQFENLRVREIVFSGGEALMHPNLWSLCKLFKRKGIKLTLLTTGLLLERNAKDVVDNLNEVIISIDGSKRVHDEIRNIPGGYDKITAGIKAIKNLKPDFLITARSVVQKSNFRDFNQTVRGAKAIGVNRISFLAADISSPAFNHETELTKDRADQIALSASEAEELESLLHTSFVELGEFYDSKFIAESPKKILSIANYYKAINGLTDLRERVCNAPWVSAVIESDGQVMPCFFHEPYGSIYNSTFESLVNSAQAIKFRKDLNVRENPICQRCVCSLKLGVTQ